MVPCSSALGVQFEEISHESLSITLPVPKHCRPVTGNVCPPPETDSGFPHSRSYQHEYTFHVPDSDRRRDSVRDPIQFSGASLGKEQTDQSSLQHGHIDGAEGESCTEYQRIARIPSQLSLDPRKVHIYMYMNPIFFARSDY